MQSTSAADRLYAAAAEHERKIASLKAVTDPECTFSPTLTKKATALKERDKAAQKNPHEELYKRVSFSDDRPTSLCVKVPHMATGAAAQAQITRSSCLTHTACIPSPARRVSKTGERSKRKRS